MPYTVNSRALTGEKPCINKGFLVPLRGWSGGAMVLGKLPVPGRPTLWMTVGQGPIALAVGAGGGGLDIFTLIYLISSLSPSLWETARYRLKYCLKGPLNPKQPTNQIVPLMPRKLTFNMIVPGPLKLFRHTLFNCHNTINWWCNSP